MANWNRPTGGFRRRPGCIIIPIPCGCCCPMVIAAILALLGAVGVLAAKFF